MRNPSPNQVLRGCGLALSLICAGIYLSLCDMSYTTFHSLLAGYIVGILVAFAPRSIRKGLGGFIAQLMSTGALIAVGLWFAFMISFARCFQF